MIFESSPVFVNRMSGLLTAVISRRQPLFTNQIALIHIIFSNLLFYFLEVAAKAVTFAVHFKKLI